MPNETAQKPQTPSPFDAKPQNDGLDGVGDFLSSTNNYERIWAAENSVPGYRTATGNKKKNLNKKVRNAVGAEVDAMAEDGSISPGPVLDTYQSSYDHGNDFGGEVALNGVYGNEYVLHGHYNSDGTTKPGSVGVKHASDQHGMRIAHGVNDNLGGNPAELFSHYAS